LEVGCGTGYVLASLALALKKDCGATPRLLATDVNPRAAAATISTLAAHGLGSLADVVVTDLVQCLQPRMNGLIDLLVFNPPYVSTPDEEVARGGLAAAWAGGNRGRVVIDRLLPLLPALLSSRGEVLMICLQENQPDGEKINLQDNVFLLSRQK
jgi:release factor glutamine methyltransferase